MQYSREEIHVYTVSKVGKNVCMEDVELYELFLQIWIVCRMLNGNMIRRIVMKRFWPPDYTSDAKAGLGLHFSHVGNVGFSRSGPHIV